MPPRSDSYAPTYPPTSRSGAGPHRSALPTIVLLLIVVTIAVLLAVFGAPSAGAAGGCGGG